MNLWENEYKNDRISQSFDHSFKDNAFYASDDDITEQIESNNSLPFIQTANKTMQSFKQIVSDLENSADNLDFDLFHGRNDKNHWADRHFPTKLASRVEPNVSIDDLVRNIDEYILSNEELDLKIIKTQNHINDYLEDIQNLKQRRVRSRNEIEYLKEKLKTRKYSQSQFIQDRKKKIFESKRNFEPPKNALYLNSQVYYYNSIRERIQALDSEISKAQLKCSVQSHLLNSKMAEIDSIRQYIVKQKELQTVQRNSLEELIEQVQITISKRNRSQSRMLRMEKQIQKLIEVESAIRHKDKKLRKKIQTQNTLSELLEALQSKLNSREHERSDGFRQAKIEERCLKDVLMDLQQRIIDEETDGIKEQKRILDQFVLPVFPIKIYTNQFHNDEKSKLLLSQIESIRNHQKRLLKEMEKTEQRKNNYHHEIDELDETRQDMLIKSQLIQLKHTENVDILYKNVIDLCATKYEIINELQSSIEHKTREIREKKKSILNKCETYFSIMMEYGSKWK